jgi:hypothetical protein
LQPKSGGRFAGRRLYKKPPCLVNKGFSGDIRKNKKDNEKEVTSENS